jgi:hypothetical protein
MRIRNPGPGEEYQGSVEMTADGGLGNLERILQVLCGNRKQMKLAVEIKDAVYRYGSG